MGAGSVQIQPCAGVSGGGGPDGGGATSKGGLGAGGGTGGGGAGRGGGVSGGAVVSGGALGGGTGSGGAVSGTPAGGCGATGGHRTQAPAPDGSNTAVRAKTSALATLGPIPNVCNMWPPMDICSLAYDEVAVADEPNPVRDKGLADILVESFGLYRTHARPLLLACALVFVPVSLAKSCATSVILTPTLAARSATDMVELARGADDSRRALADAYSRNADAETIDRLQRENQRRLEQVSHEASRIAGGIPGRWTLWLVGVLATLVSALAFAVAIYVTGGAVTVAVADRLTGGRAGWVETWMLAIRRLGRLLAAAVPAAGLIAIGLVFWVIPGLVVAFCFALIAQVAVIEGLGGAAALKRSTELVGSDWLRVALLFAVFAALTWAARLLADLFVPDSAIFLTELVGDLLVLAVLPLPLIANVLLYLDVRKRRDNFGDDQLRAALESLRA